MLRTTVKLALYLGIIRRQQWKWLPNFAFLYVTKPSKICNSITYPLMSPNLLSVLRDILVLGPWAATHYLPSLFSLPLSELYKIYRFGYLISNFIFSHSFFFLVKLGNLIIFLLPPTSIFTMSLTIFNWAVYLICLYTVLYIWGLYSAEVAVYFSEPGMNRTFCSGNKAKGGTYRLNISHPSTRF